MNCLRCVVVSFSVIFLCQCGGMRVRELSRSVENLPKPEFGRGAAPVSRAHVQAYSSIQKADRQRETSLPLAYLSYVEAARIVWLSREEPLIPLYNYAVGEAVRILSQTPEGSVLWKRGVCVLRRGEWSDEIGMIPASKLKITGWRTHVRQDGVGAAMVAHYGFYGEKKGKAVSGKPRVKQPHYPPGGVEMPVSVVMEFTATGRPELSVIDVTRESDVMFWGKRRKLSMDLTAPLALGMEKAREKGLGAAVRGVFNPARFQKNMGLFSVQKFDHRKIPLILVHGLVSDPSTWSNTMNELMRSQSVRSRYQVYVFYYPTGLPIRLTGMVLYDELNKLEKHYRQQGAIAQARQSVLVGHSMGGLLTSIQVRKFGADTWKRLADHPFEDLQYGPKNKKFYRLLPNKSRAPLVRRAVFISTPHRGSKLADNWIGRVVMSMIRVPQKVFELNIPDATRSVTEMGKTILNGDVNANGVRALRLNNPGLSVMVETPVAHTVRYHSIIGDRGKNDTPNSSDGVVSYHSSHLDGAESELIVPSGHSAHSHPNAVMELQRILTEHLRR